MSSIKGLDSLLDKLSALGGNTENALKQTIDDCTVFVRDDARLRCPVDTGDLRQSIQCETKVKDGGTVSGTVSTNQEYAAYVEFGTGPVGQETNENTNVAVQYRQSGWSYYNDNINQFIYTKGLPARPYMYPALKDNIEQIKSKIKNDIAEEIRRL